MPQLVFPVARAGLAVPTWVGLDGKTTSARHAAGQPISPPLQLRGLLDTAADVTAVASWVLQQLRIPAATTTVTHTAGGKVKVNLYEVSLSITSPTFAAGAWLTKSDLLVTELAVVLPDTDVLIGLDVLLECKLVLDGPGRQFSLDF